MDDRAIDLLERVARLRAAGWQLHEGESLDPGWLAAQLWDLADLLDHVQAPRVAVTADDILREVGFEG